MYMSFSHVIQEKKGCTSESAKIVIRKSIQILGGGLAFEDCQHLVEK